MVLEQLTKNQWFGEMQLIKDTPLLSSFTCHDDCLFLSVTREKFTHFIRLAPEIVDHFSALVTWRTASMLRGIDLFMGGIKENKAWSKLELLCSMFDYEFVYKEEVVMREGDTSPNTNKFYIIQQGTVCLTRGASHPSEEKGEAEEEKATVSSPPSSLSPTPTAPSSASASPRASLHIQITPSSTASPLPLPPPPTPHYHLPLARRVFQ